MRIRITAKADAARIKECIVLDGLNVPSLSFEFCLRHTENGETSLRWQRFLIQNLTDVKYASAGQIVFEFDWQGLDELPNWNCEQIHWIYGELTFQEVLSCEKICKIQSEDANPPTDKENPLDISVQINEIKKLKDGWLDGDGKAPDHLSLDKFVQLWDTYWDKKLPLPYIYPTLESGIQLEWFIKPHAISLNVEFPSQNAYFHLLNCDTDNDSDLNLGLMNSSGWAALNSMLQAAIGG